MPQQFYKPQEERIITNNKIAELAEKKGYVSFNRDKSKITYLAQGQTYNFKNPAEKVRLEFYFDLMEKYEYPMANIEFEAEIPGCAPSRYADIVIYDNATKKNAYIVIECRKGGISDVEFEQAVKLAVDNAKTLGALFAVCLAGSKKKVIRVSKWNSREPEKSILSDIPIAYSEIK